MSHSRDLSFEALVEVTGASIAAERGALNKALQMIRMEEPELEDEDLAMLVRLRAESYRKAWPHMALTPTALAKHWGRIEESVQKPTYAEPLGQPSRCPTCDGHKMVLVRERSSPNPRSGFDEWAPCPSCNSTTSGNYWRTDGSRHQVLDPEEVRKVIE